MMLCANTLTTSADATVSATIDGGKVTVEMATLAGLPVTVSNPGWLGDWQSIASNLTPVSGATASAHDFDGLGFVDGTSASFRAHYTPPPGAPPKADEHKSPIIDVTAVADTCDGFNVSADFASGDGDPPPGANGPWAFRITLENCTGVNLTGIKAQGGSNGWAPMTTYLQSKGSVYVRLNQKNQLLTWNLDMPNGTTETILVTVNGKIPASAVCDSIRYLSGPWSAVYNPGGGSLKSPYTGRVSVQVTCP